jgi:2,3,4,5-tetrahydropyridine-2,6-dicarboxylate N-succinyltransferase
VSGQNLDRVNEFLDQLERGEVRSASFSNGEWSVHPEVKEGILGAIRAGQLVQMGPYVDKHTLPVQSFGPERRIRLVPGGSSVRRGAYIAPTVVIMPPAYVNIGAYIEEGTMVDSHVLVGSCAQIGKRVHLSAGVQIGGVLEPIGQMPVIVEDDAFLGAQVVVVEGIRVGKRAVLAPGVVLSRGVAIYDAVKERVLERGAAVPENAVVVPGSRPLSAPWARSQGLQVSCPVIIKYRDEKSDASLVLESIIREGL